MSFWKTFWSYATDTEPAEQGLPKPTRPAPAMPTIKPYKGKTMNYDTELLQQILTELKLINKLLKDTSPDGNAVQVTVVA